MQALEIVLAQQLVHHVDDRTTAGPDIGERDAH
jgi:hypothetical protein